MECDSMLNEKFKPQKHGKDAEVKMGLWSQMKTWFILHLIIGYIFVVSGLIVTFLMLCSCVIWPFNKLLYRKVNVHLAYSHWCHFTFLAQWWSGSDCLLHVSDEDRKMIGKEHVLVIMNHKYDIDWLMAWILAERFGMLGGTKIYGKEMLKYVPLIGWAWYFTESIFLKRKWESDRKTLVEDLARITDYPDDYWVTLLLFPEGTRFTETKHQASLEVSRAKGYKDMKHHLLPRPKGFILSINGLRGKIPTVLDLTIGFDQTGPEPTLMNIIQGKPLLSRLRVRRINLESVPVDTDAHCAEWLRNLFHEKDEIYDHFVQTNTLKGKGYHEPRRYRDLIFFLMWAVITCVPLFYYLGGIFLSGSLTQQLICVVVVAIASVGVRMMIGVTEINRGSTYGKKEN
ncbi:1-acyl-sn-glycerol-3-phosphate acyltransferase gamma-like isoform X1 [Haliotis rufescens]|uniref:1-acyl-sn-glycerol-3-phosphate acyltransferase gamma-like isoform X1 n=2 Tax=Haliotis rufescens TaxID=6454 RepID=UPI001EB09160|nr:1-acyl-sn-glycerol-3-phosphate acyltransferase gamma-like isoform X1 [Haliotis rufescens]